MVSLLLCERLGCSRYSWLKFTLKKLKKGIKSIRGDRIKLLAPRRSNNVAYSSCSWNLNWPIRIQQAGKTEVEKLDLWFQKVDQMAKKWKMRLTLCLQAINWVPKMGRPRQSLIWNFWYPSPSPLGLEKSPTFWKNAAILGYWGKISSFFA